METKDCGRWALYGSSEVAGVSATGGPVAGVLVAGGSVLHGALNSDGSELG